MRNPRPLLQGTAASSPQRTAARPGNLNLKFPCKKFGQPRSKQ
jgi:hypothetical protein